MSVVLEIRNPVDLITTYDQIEVQRSTTNTVAGMANITTSLAIDTTTASDLSTGYTSYTDTDGTSGTHYYRFRYKVSLTSTYSAYSDIFLSGSNVIQQRFRRIMRDTNTNKYFFTQDDLDYFEDYAVQSLYPITWIEDYSDSAFVPDGTTEIFNFPVNVTRVSDLDLIDSSGNNLGKLMKWQVRGRKLIFDQAPRSGTIIRAWVEKRFTKLAEVPEIWDGLILNRMRLQAFETFEADRSKYYKYNSVAKPEGGNLPSLDRIISRIETQIRLRENQIKRVRRPQFVSMI